MQACGSDFGKVLRTFSVAQDGGDAKAHARYTDGELTLELPKKAGEQAKKLAVGYDRQMHDTHAQRARRRLRMR